MLRTPALLIAATMIATAISGCSGPLVRALQLPTSVSHIRTLQARVTAVLEDGVRGSATFRNLVGAIESSDIIVYIELAPYQSTQAKGGLRFISATAKHRFLLISLSFGPNYVPSQYMLIGLLGHELQHVLEVAQSPEVRTEDAFHELYERIGFFSRQNAYDTDAALEVGARIWAELRQN